MVSARVLPTLLATTLLLLAQDGDAQKKKPCAIGSSPIDPDLVGNNISQNFGCSPGGQTAFSTLKLRSWGITVLPVVSSFGPVKEVPSIEKTTRITQNVVTYLRTLAYDNFFCV